MDMLDVAPGDLIKSNFGGYDHWSIVSDSLCENGKFKLISATKRNGTVKEEEWDVVVNDKYTVVSNVESKYSPCETIANARSQIDSWKYSLFNNNCEDFVYWASGINISSKQVVGSVTGATIGTAAVALFSDKPTSSKLLFGGAIGLFFGLLVGRDK
ncbi:lecithin retinol acyltransferase family protein [Aliivibrio sifiae]|uniref:lecithin retinol acyltransferase family protein n=1 Tax=Aliivibrio sp. 1S128 TaxID=1840085 RepID=UPI00080DF62A|nr:lecithin retinol acyltransferase family protein [Aliivibrio sp. 1S128]OCH11338.1 hypothetical protein A6E03_19070 [Aliivibrio sp. 1S128]